MQSLQTGLTDSYVSDRVLTYETADGTRNMQITAGAARESILELDLWNISYDDILRMDMPEGTYLSGYADDIMAKIALKHLGILMDTKLTFWDHITMASDKAATVTTHSAGLWQMSTARNRKSDDY